MDTVYIDTTIPSYYHGTRTDAVTRARQELTAAWWQGPRLTYEVVSSAFMLDELKHGSYPAQAQCLALVRGIRLLPLVPKLGDVVRAYIQRGVMPAEEAGDAAHLAMASLHKIDYLVTWNLKHLANVNKLRHIRLVNAQMGLWTPEIVTPEFFMEEERP